MTCSQVWCPILGICCSAFNPSKCTRTAVRSEQTHARTHEQWTHTRSSGQPMWAELQKKMGSQDLRGKGKWSRQGGVTHEILLSRLSPKIARKLPDIVDSVHRLGQKRGDGRPRVIIIQFAMRLYRDTVWRDAKDITI